jgi:hypothetical protein
MAGSALPFAHEPSAGLELELPLNVELARALQLAGKAGELALHCRRQATIGLLLELVGHASCEQRLAEARRGRSAMQSFPL